MSAPSTERAYCALCRRGRKRGGELPLKGWSAADSVSGNQLVDHLLDYHSSELPYQGTDHRLAVAAAVRVARLLRKGGFAAWKAAHALKAAILVGVPVRKKREGEAPGRRAQRAAEQEVTDGRDGSSGGNGPAVPYEQPAAPVGGARQLDLFLTEKRS